MITCMSTDEALINVLICTPSRLPLSATHSFPRYDKHVPHNGLSFPMQTAARIIRDWERITIMS